MRVLTCAGLALTLLLGIGSSAVAAPERGLVVEPKNLAEMRSEKRLALVIGNSAYRRLRPLRNPINDAKAVAAALRRAGFEVALLENTSQKKIKRAVVSFERRLNQGGVGLFYYAGHGVQVGGNNYLVPLDAEIDAEEHVDIEAVGLNYVLSRMAAARNRLNIVILDACRNNPFEGRFRDVSRGLAPAKAPVGTYVVYATAEGDVAADGDGQNSLFSGALVKALDRRNVKLEDMFKRVRTDVLAATSGKQVPWTSSSVTGDFYFHLPKAGPQGVAGSSNAAEIEYWSSIKNSTNPKSFEAYLADYPNGRYARLARIKLEELSGTQTAAITVPPKPRIEIQPMEAAYVAVRNANVRASPSAEATRTASLSSGTKVTVTGKVKGANWYRVSRSGKQLGFVYGPLLKEVAVVVPPKPQAPKSVKPAVGVFPSLTPGTVFKDCDECPEMVVVPAGTFMMGSNDGDSDEKPVHRVTIPRPFAVGKYEVTFSEWDACVAARGCSRKPGDSGWGRGRRPAINVDWDDAQEYVKWLSRRTRKSYRLLSEAEWEYAAQGGAGSQAFGKGNANCRGCGSRWGGKQTAPVGSFRANGFGLHDMLGNLWEWGQDCWNESYSGAPSDGSAWTSGDCSRRVLRGGSWYYFPRLVRSAFRDRGWAAGRGSFVGFRISRTHP